MLLDVQLPGISGLETIERIAKLKNPEAQPTIIMISGHATLADAVRATKAGAYDLIEKPLDRERLMVALRNALERRAMAREVEGLRAMADERHEMVGRSAPMAGAPRPDRQGRADPHARAHHRRVGDGQGAHRPGDPPRRARSPTSRS